MSYRLTPLPAASELLAEASRIYTYDPSLGWLVRRAHADPKHPGRGRIGERVGGDDGHGYLMCLLLGHKFKVHQIVWLLCTGTLPTMALDHANRNKRDNRIENLRLATDQQNLQNLTASTRPYAGVRFEKHGRGHRAVIQRNGKKQTIGRFATPELAHAAYVEACRKYRGEFSSV